MAGQISSFLNGSMLVITIGKVTLAYCQSLSFNQNMNLTPVGGIGAFSSHALEPVQFAAGGSMRVVRWTSEEWTQIGANAAPDNLPSSTLGKDFTSGNGVIDINHFNPVNLLLSATFDIEVYGRQEGANPNALSKIYTLNDCRLTNYSFSFQPGSLLFEDMSFVCLQVQDETSVTSGS
jgi:hypothetical protein